MKFDMNIYFTIGMVLFAIMAVSNTYSITVTWDLMDLGARVARIAGVAFNLALVALFIFLKKNQVVLY